MTGCIVTKRGFGKVLRLKMGDNFLDLFISQSLIWLGIPQPSAVVILIIFGELINDTNSFQDSNKMS